jgi:hypothetical protein
MECILGIIVRSIHYKLNLTTSVQNPAIYVALKLPLKIYVTENHYVSHKCLI